MSIPEHRFSDILVDAEYIPPEEEPRYDRRIDMEGGPIAVTNTTGGMNYQPWDLSIVVDTVTLTPRNTGSPVSVLSASNIIAASFCFDQNARPSVVYQTPGGVYHYWYDSDMASFVTTAYPDMVSAVLSLDDKRSRQVNVNDIILWYTREVTPGVYNVFTREQRDRFTIEYPMLMDGVAPSVPPNLWKAGMHKGLRGKIVLRYS